MLCIKHGELDFHSKNSNGLKFLIVAKKIMVQKKKTKEKINNASSFASFW